MRKIRKILDAIKSCEIAMNYYKDKDETKYLYFKEAKEKLEKNLINNSKLLKFIEISTGISTEISYKSYTKKTEEEKNLYEYTHNKNVEIISGNKHYF